MDYKEKVIALLNSQELSKEQKEKLENIFPELKESEDEIIKKMCIKYLDRGYQHCSFADDRKNIEKCIAWLEKQEQKSKKVSIWKHWKNGIAGNGEGKQIYLIKMGNTYNLSSVLSCECNYIQLSELDNLMLEKQSESDETKAKMFLINKGYPIDTNGIFPTYEEMYNIIRNGLEEQNPAWSEKDKNLLNRLIGVLDGTNEEDYHEGWEEKFLPWLKTFKERMQPKQCEHLENFDNGEDYGIDGLYHAIRILERTIGKVTGYQSDDGILEHKAAINAVKELYKKQGEKNINHIDIKEKAHQIAWETSKDYDPSLSKESWCEMAALDMASWLEKQGEQKPTDKVEPKSHEGEWLCENEPNNYARFIQILEIVNVQGKERYRISRDIHNDEDIVEFDFVEKYYHKFDIKDAKDGDVLTNGESIVIFKQIVEPKYRQYIEAYIGLDLSCNIQVTSESWSLGIDKTMPATKEQRDILFAKMKEAGYEWDAEKKELKKIEQKTLDANKVIAWLVANICDFEYYVTLFKKDFGIC